MDLHAGGHAPFDLGPQARKPDPAPKQISNRTVLGAAAVGFREEVGPEKIGDLLAVNLVILGLRALDGLHVEGMSESEVNPRVGARIAEPVPIERALTGDGQVMSIRLDQLQEIAEVVVADVSMQQDLAFAVHDAGVHALGMQVDSAVELGLGLM